MAFLKTDTMYSELVQKICDLSSSNKLGHIPIVHYHYQNEKVCTFVRITNDKDIDIMFRASAGMPVQFTCTSKLVRIMKKRIKGLNKGML